MEQLSPKEMQERVDKQNVLLGRVKDLIGDQPEKMAVDLMGLVVRLIAELHPGEISPQTKEVILENYMHATDELISERAMSKPGVLVALELAKSVAEIAIDYNPESRFNANVVHDNGVPKKVKDVYSTALKLAYNDAVMSGLTPFGATVTMVLRATTNGYENGLGSMLMTRALTTGLDVALAFMELEISSGSTLPVMLRPRLTEDEIATKLALSLGVSKNTAKKYIKIIRLNDLSNERVNTPIPRGPTEHR